MSEYRTMTESIRDIAEEEHLKEAPLVTDIDKAFDLIARLLKQKMNKGSLEQGVEFLDSLAKIINVNVTSKGQQKGRVFIWDLAKKKL